MTRKLQILRGTTTQNNAYTGAVGELTMDTDRNEVRIHDGQTVGGIKIGDRNMPILTSMFFDHIINDMSWLRADDFSWHSGDVYKAAYEHLCEDMNAFVYRVGWNASGIGTVFTRTTNPKVGDVAYADENFGTEQGKITEVGVGEIKVNGTLYNFGYFEVPSERSRVDTIGGISVRYDVADDGHKICVRSEESDLTALYEAIGSADYYILDIGNKRFKLPRKYKPKRELIKAVKNSDDSWYNLYSDGWVEQGGNHDRGTGGAQVNLLIRMSNQDYDIQLTSYNIMRYAAVLSYTDSYFTVVTADDSTANNDYPVHWQVSGYAHESELINIINQPFEYYYAGNFEQSAVEQTAGLNAELFNGKADVNLNNINPSSSAKAMIVGWGMPDYTAGVALSDITSSNPYTSTVDCVLYGTAYNGAVYVNGNIVAYADGTNYAFPITVILPKGDIITTTATKISRVYMIPLKGVN